MQNCDLLKKRVTPLISFCQVLYSGSDPKIIIRRGFCFIHVKHILLPAYHIPLFLLFCLPSFRMIRTSIGCPHHLLSSTFYWWRNLRFLFFNTHFFVFRNYKFIYGLFNDAISNSVCVSSHGSINE